RRPRRGFDPGRFPAAIGLSSQIVGNVQEGVLRAESVVTHPGRTVVVVETKVTTDTGRLLVLVTPDFSERFAKRILEVAIISSTATSDYTRHAAMIAGGAVGGSILDLNNLGPRLWG